MDTHTQTHMYKLHETLHDILTYVYMHGQLYPNMQGSTHMHCLKETTDEEQNSSFTNSPSHAMSLAVMAYMHELMMIFLY